MAPAEGWPSHLPRLYSPESPGFWCTVSFRGVEKQSWWRLGAVASAGLPLPRLVAPRRGPRGHVLDLGTPWAAVRSAAWACALVAALLTASSMVRFMGMRVVSPRSVSWAWVPRALA